MIQPGFEPGSGAELLMASAYNAKLVAVLNLEYVQSPLANQSILHNDSRCSLDALYNAGI